MQLVEKDPSGYYITRWDRAIPVTVRAADRAEAFKKAWAVMGESPSGHTWTARIVDITEMEATP